MESDPHGGSEPERGAAEPEGDGSPLRVESHDEGVTVLTLDRPDRLNAVSPALYRALLEALDAVESDDAARAVVVTGAGRAFCAGADLQAHGEGPPDRRARRRYARSAQEVNRRLQTLSLPVVAAVNGHAIGAGLELALSCDLIVVAEEAKLRFPEVALGTFVGGGVTHTLPARVGSARARELLLLARFFRGTDAEAMGLANAARPAEEVLETAMEMGRELARHAPVPMRRLKAMLTRAEHEPLEAVLRAEEEALLECMDTRDWKEGVEAFHEKRPPRFRGE